MDYHLFKKAVKSKNKTVRRRYYYFIDQVYAEAPFHNLPYIPAPSFPKFKRNTIKKDIFSTAELNRLFDENVWRTLHKHMYEKLPQYDEGYVYHENAPRCCRRDGSKIGGPYNACLNRCKTKNLMKKNFIQLKSVQS